MSPKRSPEIVQLLPNTVNKMADPEACQGPQVLPPSKSVHSMGHSSLDKSDSTCQHVVGEQIDVHPVIEEPPIILQSGSSLAHFFLCRDLRRNQENGAPASVLKYVIVIIVSLEDRRIIIILSH